MVTLVRKSSDTPNITNKDDTKMIRYAYGGYNGYQKDYLDEFGYTYENKKFHIGGGRASVQGWEVDLDSAGFTVELNGIYVVESYSIYLEVNVLRETAEIKSIYANSTQYPEVDEGDDLTKYPSGTARLLLYQLTIRSGQLTVEKKIKVIPYAKDIAEDVSQRLTKLGFRKGECEISPANSILPDQVHANEIIKIGTNVYVNLNIDSPSGSWLVSGTIATIPEEFRPDRTIEFYGLMAPFFTSSSNIAKLYGSKFLLTTEGEIKTETDISMFSGGILNFGYCMVDPSQYEE